jgi:uncharacterized membrane protein
MIKFIFFILFFVILLMFLAGFSVIRGIRDILFGSPSGRQRTAASGKNASRRQTASQKKQKKIFRKDEGEYIDYEEIK